MKSNAMPAAAYILKMAVAHASGFLEASTMSLLVCPHRAQYLHDLRTAENLVLQN
jgi:hypothetical protein